GGVLTRDQYRRDRLRKEALGRGARMTAVSELADLLQGTIDAAVIVPDPKPGTNSGDSPIPNSDNYASDSSATVAVFDEIEAIGRSVKEFPSVNRADAGDAATCTKIARIVRGESLRFFHWVADNRKDRLHTVRSLGLLVSWADDYAKYRGFHS